MQIKIIAMGQITEKYHKELIDESISRLKSSYNYNLDIQITHIKEERLSQNPSELEIEKALDKEAEVILSKLNPDDFLICLDIHGKVIKDKVLNKIIELSEKRNKKNIVFAIGSSYGLSDKIKKRANILMSFGKITLNHQIVPALLLDVLSYE